MHGPNGQASPGRRTALKVCVRTALRRLRCMGLLDSLYCRSPLSSRQRHPLTHSRAATGPPCSRRPQAVAISLPTTPAPRTRLARRKGKSASTPAIFPLWTICGCLTLHITVPANGNGEPQRTALRGLRCMWLLDGGVVDQTPSISLFTSLDNRASLTLLHTNSVKEFARMIPDSVCI